MSIRCPSFATYIVLSQTLFLFAFGLAAQTPEQRFGLSARAADAMVPSHALVVRENAQPGVRPRLAASCDQPAVEPGALAFAASGEAKTVAIVMEPECARTWASQADWATVYAERNITGSFLASVVVPPNPGPARSTTVRFGNRVLAVQQAAGNGCTVTPGTSAISVDREGGFVPVSFQFAGERCEWEAVSSVPWAIVEGVSSGNGFGGAISLRVDPLTDARIRIGNLIVNGREIRVEQLGFDRSLPAEVRAVSNAATFNSFELAAGGLATVFGNQLAHTVAHAESIPLPTQLGGIRLRVGLPDGSEVAAPLLYVSPGQINFQIPEAAAGSMKVRVEAVGRGSIPYVAMVEPFLPSLFEVRYNWSTITAAGYAQLVYPDGSQRLTFLDECIPLGGCFPRAVDRGPVGSELYIVLFGTGFPSDASVSEYQGPAAEARFVVRYAGRHPDFVGLQQINIHIPQDVPISGFVDFDVSVRGRKTRTLPILFAPLNW
jgi:uncharacterized protein (TIGR03437 family)